MSQARCATCGEGIRFNTGLTSKGRPVSPRWAPGGENYGGRWYHSDDYSAPKRDHAAAPEDGRSGADEVTRETALKDQARASVNSTLQKGFDYLHAENMVNDLFKDRRGG